MALVAAIAAILALAGVLSNGDDEQPVPATTTVPVGGPDAPEPVTGDGATRPRVTTVRVGGRPTAVLAGPGGVWVADSFSRRASVLDSESKDAKPTAFSLEGPASDVAATDDAAWFALPEQQALERRHAKGPEGSGELIEVAGFPSVLAGADEAVYALSDRAVEAIDADTAEVVDEFRLGGFGSGLAVGEGYVWAAVDNRNVVRIDPESGESDGGVRVPEVFTVTADGGFVWALSASGRLTRIAPDTLEATVAPQSVRGALDVAAGLGSVWVTSSRRTVTQLDPESLEPRGAPLKVGDEPASVSVDAEAVWVANGGDGTLTRIEP
ncbi:MAG TPA: hypothetical protein VK920_03035 [Solirubrobacterales bacterium]|nr:hypothetical protein [Solirubrobacterales bacterium]